MNWQYILIGIIVVLAVAYMLWRGYKMWTHVGDKCYGCSGCALKDAMLQKHGNSKGKPNCYHKK